MEVELFYDYASPFSYLADAIIDRKLPGVTVRYRPIYLRGLPGFDKGYPGGAAKLRYLMEDLERCAAHEGVPIDAPAEFPVNGLYALRAILAEEGDVGLHRALFQAVWRDRKKISSAAAVQEIAGRAIPRMEDPEIKERLKSDTAAALARGVFGVPTFFVGDQMFWGHDRMDFVARALGL